MTPNKNVFDEDTIIHLRFIKLLEQKESQIKKEMAEMQNQLMEYLNREFIANDYGRRYNIQLERLVLSLIGDENINAEMVRQNQMQRVSIKYK